MSNYLIPEHLIEAFDELNQLKNPKWAYTICTKDTLRETVVHFDPSKTIDEQYVLLSVDGRKPSGAETRTYQEKKAKIIRGSRTGLTIKTMPDAEELIHRGTLKLLSENDELIRYRFKPKLDIPIAKHVIHKLEGEMYFCKKHQILERVTIANVKSFTPAPTFKIEKLFAEAVFKRSPQGNLQLSETKMDLKGKKFFIGSLNQATTTNYLDHVQVIFD